MVQFETEIYEKNNDGDIIGAEVVVFSDDETEIGRIYVTNQTDYDELVLRIDNLADTFVPLAEGSSFAGSTLEDILANTEEEADINATTLQGFASDALSKVGHTHSKSAITDLYDYNISLSAYEVSTSEEVTVTVNVKNQSNQPVGNHSFIIYKDDTSWKTASTDSQGVYTTTFTPTTEGMVSFKSGNQRVELKVDGVKESVTYTSSNMHSGRFTSDSRIYFEKIGKLVIMTYYIELNVNINDNVFVYICNLPSGYYPNHFNYKTAWTYGNAATGQLRIDNNEGTPKLRFQIATSSTNRKPLIIGQMMYFTQ